jgi:small-conductance mechanosensitive channel
VFGASWLSVTIDRLLSLLRKEEIARDLLVSAVIVLAVYLIRRALIGMLRAGTFGSERDRLRWLVQVRRGAWVVGALAIVPLWATELHTFALSVVALGAALVLATKELILCVMGGVLKTTSEAFEIGDRIEIDGARGDVINHGWLATTLLEIGSGHQWTGRALTIPNSKLLSHPVINETFTEAYVLHVIEVPLGPSDDVGRAETLLLAAAQEACSDYLEAAERHMGKHTRAQGLPAPTVTPRVIVQIPDAGKVTLLLRLPTPAREKGVVEQRVLRQFLERYRSAAA